MEAGEPSTQLSSAHSHSPSLTKYPPPLVITVPVVLGTLSERCKGVVGCQYNVDETSCCNGLKGRYEHPLRNPTELLHMTS